jgi:outer membrane protein
MNKIKIFILAAVMVAGASTVNAQKSGYISVEQVMSLMPELTKIDTVLQKYQADSVNTEFASLIQEYNYKDSILNKTDTTKIPVAVKRQHRQDLEQIAYQVQNWQQISQQAMQAKQQQLLGPVYQRVYGAINAVAKENNYAFVYAQEALLVAPPNDNLLPLVAKKLNIKLPTQGGQPQAANSGVTPNRPAPGKRQ